MIVEVGLELHDCCIRLLNSAGQVQVDDVLVEELAVLLVDVAARSDGIEVEPTRQKVCLSITLVESGSLRLLYIVERLAAASLIPPSSLCSVSVIYGEASITFFCVTVSRTMPDSCVSL